MSRRGAVTHVGASRDKHLADRARKLYGLTGVSYSEFSDLSKVSASKAQQHGRRRPPR